MKLFDNQKYKNNILHLHNTSLDDLSSKIGTPYFVFDEELIRARINLIRKKLAFNGINLKIAYSSKAFLNSYMVKVINQENCHFDAVTQGEFKILKENGVLGHKIELQGNNKSVIDLTAAKDNGIGTIIVDNLGEIDDIVKVYKNSHVNILLRVDPLVIANTHEYIQTSSASKFALPMEKQVIEKLIQKIFNNPNLHFAGFHYHIGSQIKDFNSFIQAFDSFYQFHAKLENKYQKYETLNIGGGFGVYYSVQDCDYNPVEQFDLLQSELKDRLKKLKNLKTLVVEPGRFITANAGSTVYQIGYTKQYPNKNYAFVDGGMSDNIRKSLYQAEYEAALIKKSNREKITYCVAGKLCESGDIIIDSIDLEQVNEGDLLIVNSTGAYCQSMESNYNKMQKLPIVFVNKEKAILTTKKQPIEQLLINDCEEIL
jgi:diaminopimelate decarboxylase